MKEARVRGMGWRGRAVFWLGVLVVWAGVVGRGVGVGAVLSEEQLGSKLTTLLASSPLREAEVGLCVVRVSDGSTGSPQAGRTVFSHNAERLFIPASNEKLLVTAAALGLLGTDYRFRSEVFSDVAPEGAGVIHGNLYLKGYGDPTLARSDLAGLVEAMKKDGVRSIAGDLVADDSFFSGSGIGSGWLSEYLDEPYAAPASALSLEGNVVKVIVSPGLRAGGKAKFRVEPFSPLVSISNECLTAKKGTRSWTSLSRIEGNSFRLRGRIAAGHAPIVHEASVREPSLFAASVFGEMLRAGGIGVKGKVRLGVAPEGAVPLGRDWSAPLGEIVAVMNKESDNHYAEQILRALGAEVKGRGDDVTGIAAVGEFLSALLPGLPLPVIRDGCGLSRENGVAPSFVAALLRRLTELPNGEAFRESLAIAGVDGTLKRRMKEMAGKVYAKTGTLKGVSALSGYVVRPFGKAQGKPCSPQVMGKEGPVVAFSLLINGFSCPEASIREVRDKICGVVWEYGEGL